MQLSLRGSSPGRVPVMGIVGTNSKATQGAIAPIVITAVGVDERLLFAISLFLKNGLGDRYVLGGPGGTDIWLFDLDHMDGRCAWDAHQSERLGTPAILLSIASKDLERTQNAALARKPLNAKVLKHALEAVGLSTKEKSSAFPTQTDARDATRDVPNNTTESSAALSTPSTRAKPAAEPDTFMPDSAWYQESLAIFDAPEAELFGGREAMDEPQGQRSPPGCYGAAAKLREQHGRVSIGSMLDIEATDSQQLAKAQFDPNRFLAGTVSRAAAAAVRDQQPVRVSGHGWDIVIRPNPDRAFVDIKTAHLRTLATLPLNGGVTTKVLNGSANGRGLGQVLDGEKWRLPALIWTLTLMAARGRVPIGTDLSAKIKLTQWPNLTRLQTFPHAMRIASLWSRQPISLLESAIILGIPQRYVFAFYSAVKALELVETHNTQDTMQHRHDNRPARRSRGLFRKILAHLRLG